MDDLRREVMINQFVSTVGCMPQEARELLKSSNWQYEIALSRYFQESGIASPRSQHQMRPLTNTPATPPGFPEAMLNFSKMKTSDAAPSQTTGTKPQCPQQPSVKTRLFPK